MNRYWFLILFLSASCFGEGWEEFNPFQRQLSKEYVTKKIRHFLQGSKEIENYFEIQEHALILFASPEDKKKGNAEYQLFFGDAPSFEQKKSLKTLSHAKIAIDPGHFGGKFAPLEERYVEMEHNGHLLRFDEGTLSFLTALHLKALLEGEGASVFLSRKGIGEGAYPEDFFDWLKKHPQLWEKGVPLSTIFLRHYNRLDLRERARIINLYEPDLTILIHYNAIDSELPYSNQTKPTLQNFNLVFIPGSFSQGELASPEDRCHFLRLICTQDLEHSFTLAKTLVKSFTTYLNVSPLKPHPYPEYESPLSLAEGVFSRNLCLTRLIKGPLCYGETLIQNNLQEALALSGQETTVQGIPCPQRVVEVSQAYFEAICSFFQSHGEL